MESRLPSPIMGIRDLDHHNFTILTIESVETTRFGQDFIDYGGALILDGDLMDFIIFGQDLDKK